MKQIVNAIMNIGIDESFVVRGVAGVLAGLIGLSLLPNTLLSHL
jgi:hypothetical protein